MGAGLAFCFTAAISVFAGAGGNSGVPGDRQVVADHIKTPVRHFREDRAQFQHLIFDREGHDSSETHLFLLAVGEAGHFLALNKKLAVRRLDVMQRPGGMANDARLACRQQ